MEGFLRGARGRASVPRLGDLADTVAEAIEKGRKSRLNAAVAVLVAISATFMALCRVKDGNVVQAMSVAQASRHAARLGAPVRRRAADDSSARKQE